MLCAKYAASSLTLRRGVGGDAAGCCDWRSFRVGSRLITVHPCYALHILLFDPTNPPNDISNILKLRIYFTKWHQINANKKFPQRNQDVIWLTPADGTPLITALRATRLLRREDWG